MNVDVAAIIAAVGTVSPQVFALIGAVGAITGLVSLLVAIRARRFSREVAAAQRVFESPDPRLAIFGENGVANDAINLEIALPFRPNRFVDFPLLLTIVNVGDKSASDLLLSVRCRRELRFGGAVTKVTMKGPLPGVRVSHVEEENFANTLTAFPLIHPKAEFHLTDRITLRKATELKSTVTVETKDKVKLDIGYAAAWAYVITFILQYRDAKPISRRVTIRVHDIDNSPVEEYFRNCNSEVARRTAKQSGRGQGKSLVATWPNVLTRFRSRGRIDYQRFSLLFIDSPLEEHSKFRNAPVDEVAPDAVMKADGLRCGDQVFIPAIGVEPVGESGWRVG